MIRVARNTLYKPLAHAYGGCLNCPHPPTVLSDQDRPHAGFGITAIRHSEEVLDSWIHFEQMPTVGETIERFVPREMDGAPYVLDVDGPLHSEEYAFDFETRRFVLTGADIGFA